MLQRKDSKRQRRAAFTLMEMLVVVAIIVALAGIGGFFIIGQLTGSQKDVASAQVNGPLTQACQAYFIKHQKYPENLDILTQQDEFKMVYLDKRDAIIDPWGKLYQYNPAGTNNNGTKPDIWTVAPDGTQIGNWSKLLQTPR